MTSAEGEQFISECRSFFDKVKELMSDNDPLPVKVGGYSINSHEVDGEVVDWSLQYLQQRNCPTRLLPHLISEVLQNVRSLLSAATAKELIEESSEKGFPPIRLMQLVIDELKKVCLKYQDNQHFERLSLDLGKLCRPQLNPVSVYAIKNTRRKMEDRHVVLQDMNAFCNLTDQVPRSYFAVFDGHAGTDAAFYAAAQLYQYLVKNPNFLSNTTVALKEAFMEADVAFIRKSKFENLKGGTTAVMALVNGNVLSVAWLGDSQAILVKEGLVTSLVDPHKPDRADEKERIAQLGGEIVYWDGAHRVNGQLAVSRAIGDASYKPYVTAEPDVVTMTLDGSEDFLILACDGLWDTIGLKEAAFLVHQHLHHSPDDLVGVSTRLVQAAKQKGSSDNISVVVVFFRDPAEIAVRPLPAAPETPPESPLSPAAMEEQQQQQRELEHLAAKWGWGQSQGAVLFGEAPWQQQQQEQQPHEDYIHSAAVEQTNGTKTSPLNPEAPEFSWNPAAAMQGAAWNQFDEEDSGQPSLMCWEQDEQQTARPAETDQSTSEVAPQRREESAALDVVDEVDRSEVLPSTEESLRHQHAADVLSSQADLKEGAPFNWNLSAPEFEFTAVRDQQGTASDSLEQPSSQPRKLSAAEVLAKSANDAELAVLLAAASDDPDEENCESADPQLVASPKHASVEEQTLLHQDSRGDTTLEEVADSEEDDWTYYSGEKGQDDDQEMDDPETCDVAGAVLSPPDVQGVENFFASTPVISVTNATAVMGVLESPVLNDSHSKEDVPVVSGETVTVIGTCCVQVTSYKAESLPANGDDLQCTSSAEGSVNVAAFDTVELSTTTVSVGADSSLEAGQTELSTHVEEIRQLLENSSLVTPNSEAAVGDALQTTTQTVEAITPDTHPLPTEEGEAAEAASEPPAAAIEETGIHAEEEPPAVNTAPEVVDRSVKVEAVAAEDAGGVTNDDAAASTLETVPQEPAAPSEAAPEVDRDSVPAPVAAAEDAVVSPTATEEPSGTAEPPAEDSGSLISDTGATVGSDKTALGSAVAGVAAAAAAVGSAASKVLKKSPVKKPTGAAAPSPKTTAAAKKPEPKTTKVPVKPAPKPAASVPKVAPVPKPAAAAAAAKKPAPVGRAASATTSRLTAAPKPGSSSAASSPTKPASPAKPASASAAPPRRPIGAAAAPSVSGATSRATATTSTASSKTSSAAAKPALTNGTVKKPAARPAISRPTSSTASAAAAEPAAAVSKPSGSTLKAAAAPSLARKAATSPASAKAAPSAAKRAPPSSAAPTKPAQLPTGAVKKPATKPGPK